MPACLTCVNNERFPDLPVRERLYVDDDWRVAHAWSSLPGWLVVIARRHTESLADHDPVALAALGRLLRAATVTLQEVVGCERTYAMLFAEAEGHRHVHFHLVPRMPWFGPEDKGPNVFRFLNVPEDEQVPVAERDRIAALIGARLTAALA